jgi:DNA-binding transcriptional MerR regulator
MTDEVLNAPAEASVNEAVSEAPIARAEESPRGAIDRAFEAMEKAEASPDRARTPDGKFAPKDDAGDAVKPAEAETPAEATPEAEKPATAFAEPPKRFSPDAKAAWGTAPEPVRAEITRAIGELEKGLAEYQTKFEPLREFDTMARQSGTTIEAALNNYVGIEKLIAADPIRGLDKVCQNMGMSLRQVAEHVMGQAPDQNASAQESIIRELRQELAAVRAEVGTVTTSIKSQNEQAVLNQITEFSKDKPRFDELSNDIAFFIQSNRAKDLQEAYELAERLNPAPQAPVQVTTPTPAAAPQPRKGNLSLTGAPTSGSNPANRQAPASARAALDNAFARAGL